MWFVTSFPVSYYNIEKHANFTHVKRAFGSDLYKAKTKLVQGLRVFFFYFSLFLLQGTNNYKLSSDTWRNLLPTPCIRTRTMKQGSRLHLRHTPLATTPYAAKPGVATTGSPRRTSTQISQMGKSTGQGTKRLSQRYYEQVFVSGNVEKDCASFLITDE